MYLDRKHESLNFDMFNDRASSMNKTITAKFHRGKSSMGTYKTKDGETKSRVNTVTHQHRISLLKEDIEEKELQ